MEKFKLETGYNTGTKINQAGQDIFYIKVPLMSRFQLVNYGGLPVMVWLHSGDASGSPFKSSQNEQAG